MCLPGRFPRGHGRSSRRTARGQDRDRHPAPRNTHALAINALLDDAAGRGTIALAELRGMTVRSLIGTWAEDFLHPNERGYAHIA
jgi:hypothetical protein